MPFPTDGIIRRALEVLQRVQQSPDKLCGPLQPVGPPILIGLPRAESIESVFIQPSHTTLHTLYKVVILDDTGARWDIWLKIRADYLALLTPQQEQALETLLTLRGRPRWFIKLASMLPQGAVEVQSIEKAEPDAIPH